MGKVIATMLKQLEGMTVVRGLPLAVKTTSVAIDDRPYLNRTRQFGQGEPNL
jgi:hypothetical protein